MRQSVLAACFVLCLGTLTSAAKRPKLEGAVGPEAVWHPGAGFVAELHQACDSQSVFIQCAARQIDNAAPAPAAAFSRAIEHDGWLNAFREVGRVDVAYVLYPFRANENYGWLLVNGSPAMVDVDDLSRLPRADLRADRAWSQILARYPNAILFPNDRSTIVDPMALVFPDGSQQFIVSYRITDRCRACALVGFAFFGYDFNSKGRFDGAHLLEVVPVQPDEDTRVRTPPRPVRVRSGQTFSLALEGQWSVDQSPSDTVARVVGSEDSGGTQMMKFEVTGSGTTPVTLRLAAEDQVLRLEIQSAPGLRR
jgi:hypothetical protein